MVDDPDVRASQERWREGRRRLNGERFRLSRVAEGLYRGRASVRGLLTPDAWLAEAPVQLEQLRLRWSADAPAASVDGTEAESRSVRPLATPSEAYRGYADAVAALAPPALFEDRPCYRLLDLAADADTPVLTFGRASFFDLINVCEAAAHELAQAGELGDLPFRRLVGDPCDLTRRPVVPAISVLTVRRAPTGDGATIVLHRRDGAKVAHAGGLYQVVPVGVFQPSSPAPGNEANDFDLWRSIAREYSEELLGHPELAGDAAPLDYDGWPFFQALQQARATGGLKVWWLGLGIDPLSLVADLLVVAVFDAEVFDQLFAGIRATNAEGELLTNLPFTEATVTRFAHHEPMQAAGAAALALAWRHRPTLLAPG